MKTYMCGIINFISNIGQGTLIFLNNFGRGVIFTTRAISCCFTPTMYWKEIGKQFIEIGFLSLPIIGLTAIFTGMVLALQSYTGFQRFNAESTIASVVVLSITRELGPVLSGLMIAGRVGASSAAQISSMKISYQIDALKTLSVNPFRYLIAPRVIATVVSLPILVAIADIIGVLGGFLVSVHKLGFNGAFYLDKTLSHFQSWDFFSGLIKAACFGLIVALISCYKGFYCDKGAKGVGLATTSTVVNSSIFILIANYILTALTFGI